MANLHTGVMNTLYGKLHSDEHFNKELKHVMEKKRQGIDIIFFRDKFGRLKVKRGGVWWVMTQLAEHDPFYKV